MSASPLLVGAYEHPGRVIRDQSVMGIHAQCIRGAVEDAGLTMADVDGLFAVGGDVTLPGLSMAEYVGLTGLRHVDTTMTGGSSPVAFVGHAATAIATGKCRVAVVSLASRARSGRAAPPGHETPEVAFESPYGMSTVGAYALAAARHMHEFGTTSAQLAEIRVAASWHASHNPLALRQEQVSVDEVLESSMISDPLHLLDCCVVSDGGGAVVVVAPEIAADLSRRAVAVLGHGEAVKHGDNGRIDLTYTAARSSGPVAFAGAGLAPRDVDYASIYDSFTITVLQTLEDLGFCQKGEGGGFVMDGALRAPDGRLPINTDGGGLCNSHPAMGGMARLLECVRQLREEAHPALQVPDCEIGLVHGSGGRLGTRHFGATLLLGREAS